MKGLNIVESLSAGAARDPNRNMGPVIIIYIFVTFTHSNIDFHKLLRKISGTLHSSLSCYYGLDLLLHGPRGFRQCPAPSWFHGKNLFMKSSLMLAGMEASNTPHVLSFLYPRR